MRAVLAIGASVVAIGVIVVASTGGGDTPSRAASTSTATTEITRQDLVEVSSEDGTLGYADSREVVNRLSGTVTWLPSAGRVVRLNQILYRVDGSPVILMDGRVPAYRALKPGVSDGADVEQLERGLRALGYDSAGAIEVDESWDSGTTAAVRRWQEDHGFSETGSIGLGRIVFQPGTRRVSEVDATLGGDGSSSAGQGGTDGASATQFASYQQPEPEDEAKKREAAEEKAKREEAKRKAAERELEQLKREQGEEQPQPQPQPQASPQGGGGDDTGSGSDSPASASSPIMSTTSTRAVVTVKLDTTKQVLARRGAAVTVELPSGDLAKGRIARVGKVATSPESEGEGQGGDDTPTIEVTVRLAKRTKALDQAPVTVNFEQSRRRHVLAIPVTALLARAGGKFAVEVRDGGGRRLVPVQPGLYADGFVEIEGRGLRPGTKVTDARV